MDNLFKPRRVEYRKFLQREEKRLIKLVEEEQRKQLVEDYIKNNLPDLLNRLSKAKVIYKLIREYEYSNNFTLVQGHHIDKYV